MADPASKGAEEDVFSFPSAASKVYPLCPEGPAKVIVARALHVLKKKPAKYVKDGEDPNREYPYVNLMLQTDKKYKDGTEDKWHNIFYSMKVSDHAKATMTDFFSSVLGIPVPVSEAKEILLVGKKVKKDDGEEKIHFVQFENMEFSVIVKHSKSEDGTKTFDNVDSIFATPEQKAANTALFRGAA